MRLNLRVIKLLNKIEQAQALFYIGFVAVNPNSICKVIQSVPVLVFKTSRRVIRALIDRFRFVFGLGHVGFEPPLGFFFG